jgi:hypothetical protein
LGAALPPNSPEAVALERLFEAEDAVLELCPLAKDTVAELTELPPNEAALSGKTERFLELLTRVRSILGGAIAMVREPWPLEGYDLEPCVLRELAAAAAAERQENGRNTVTGGAGASSDGMEPLYKTA